MLGKKVRVFVTAFVVSLFLGVPFFVCAQTPIDVTLNVPDVNYAGVATQIIGFMIPVILAGIGIGLTIMIVFFLFHMFRRMTVGGGSGDFGRSAQSLYGTDSPSAVDKSIRRHADKMYRQSEWGD